MQSLTQVSFLEYFGIFSYGLTSLPGLAIMAFVNLLPLAITHSAGTFLKLLSVCSFIYSIFLGAFGGYALASRRFNSLKGIYVSLALSVTVFVTMLDLVSFASYNRYVNLIDDLY